MRHTVMMRELRNGVLRRMRGTLATLKTPPYVAPGHYYSPLTSRSDRERAIDWRRVTPAGVDLNESGQESLVTKLTPLMDEIPEDRWQPANGMYERADAAVLHSMLRQFQPSQLLEVGSGYSTAVALDVADRWLTDLRITCVEPYPARLKALLRDGDKVTLINRPVQEAPISAFSDLRSGDFLFIDSTHVIKAGSDVVWLYLHVLPMLAPGVIVHVHDIHWPWEYPERWIREGRDWTEVYLLRAFLTHNADWEVLLMTSWLWQERTELVPESVRGEPTGSLWMRRRAG